MQFYEITIKTTHECADIVSDILFSIGCNGVNIIDADNVSELYKSDIIWDYIDESLLNNADVNVYVKGIIGEENKENTLKAIDLSIENLRSNCVFETGSLEVTVKLVNDDDWKDEWKKHYKPIVTSSVTVVPNWIDYKHKANERLLFINPGLAFGTGDHETTYMCLDILGGINVLDKSVIDIGTGSGILGIASVLCGAESAYMCDIDSVAIETAKQNIRLNSVENKVKAEVADLLSNIEIKADIIFANITADVLIGLSQYISRYLNSGGCIVLSGIIHERLDDVKNAFIKQGLKLDIEKTMGEWNALLYTLN